jgi:hypothetical protein
MLSLRELQARVMSCLLGGSTEDVSELVQARGLTTGDRLRIYRQNIIENFTESLRSSFPVTVRLVGEDYFRDAARQLQQTQPSSSGDLANVGEALPVFLRQIDIAIWRMSPGSSGCVRRQGWPRNTQAWT